eukprot:TRINITY_DN2387_c0_g1_i11.p1 TRINITY_DN2387_c0_g1~~TRINITY_DN2387_c0_g1_i11.p1  ORF type:complete len:331 (+),score=72.09 TRINITY_DN2387_c0_g1_i11:27-995(+)
MKNTLITLFVIIIITLATQANTLTITSSQGVNLTNNNQTVTSTTSQYNTSYIVSTPIILSQDNTRIQGIRFTPQSTNKRIQVGFFNGTTIPPINFDTAEFATFCQSNGNIAAVENGNTVSSTTLYTFIAGQEIQMVVIKGHVQIFIAGVHAWSFQTPAFFPLSLVIAFGDAGASLHNVTTVDDPFFSRDPYALDIDWASMSSINRENNGTLFRKSFPDSIANMTFTTQFKRNDSHIQGVEFNIYSFNSTLRLGFTSTPANALSNTWNYTLVQTTTNHMDFYLDGAPQITSSVEITSTTQIWRLLCLGTEFWIEKDGVRIATY